MLKESKKNKNQKKTVFMAMSGGVDSSVAALLMKKQGYNVIGVFMRCFNLDGCAERDAEDARRVAEKLKIPFYVWDFEKEYKKKVVEYMVNGYKKGITPNPDVMCNKEIKFGLFLEKALEMGAPACRQAGIYVATGHYVRLCKIKNPAFGEIFNKSRNEPICSELAPTDSIAGESKLSRVIFVDNLKGRGPAGNQTPETQVLTLSSTQSGPTAYSLYQAKDKNKDQSYFLWILTQRQLKHCLFPIGNYLKSEVREIARKAGLQTAEKKDSQGICFLGKVTLDKFLSQYIKPKKGDVLTVGGKKIGEHKGAQFYTIGQRHGLGIGGSEKPYYIVEKNVKRNIIIVAEGDKSQELYKNEINLIDVNFINLANSHILDNAGIKVLARVRYRQPLVKALFIIHNSLFKLIFDEPQKFVAPGQSAVFYGKKGEMLGGGVIDGVNQKC